MLLRLLQDGPPLCHHAHVRLGLCLLALAVPLPPAGEHHHHLHAAMEHFQAALGGDATRVEAHVYLGVALQQLGGRADEAARHLERALELEPGEPRIATRGVI